MKVSATYEFCKKLSVECTSRRYSLGEVGAGAVGNIRQQEQSAIADGRSRKLLRLRLGPPQCGKACLTGLGCNDPAAAALLNRI